MTENKLKRLAINLSETMPRVETVSDVYVHVRDLLKRQEDYFKHYLGPENVIKLIFYIWSYKKSDSFELGDKILSNLQFSILFDTDGETVDETCDHCSGDGRIECDECYGRGTITCDECDGDGKETCSECGGSGEIEDEEGNSVTCDECGGEKELDCDDCGGEGNVECSECDGTGSSVCNDCDGDGELETDEVTCIKTYVACWDPIVNQVISDALIDDNYFDYDVLGDANKSRLILHQEDENNEIKSWVDTEVYYTLTTTKTPKLRFSGNYIYFVSDKANNKFRNFIR